MCTVEFDNAPPSVWREEYRKARKAHRCDTCSAPIAVGERYLSVFWADDGEPRTERQCTPCDEISERFSKEHNVGRACPSSLLYFLDECANHGDEDSKRWKVACDEIRERNDRARSA